MGIDGVLTNQLKNNKVTFAEKMKHNISRGKPDKRQMFKGMINLAGQSFRGDKEAAECEE